MSREKFILDRQSDLIRAKREGRQEGIKEGEQKGRQEGIKEGEQKGKQEGIKEGRQETMKEIAKNLLKLELNSYKISHVTGLSIEEINKLKNIY
jgi:predicted transposase YdaD